MLLNALEVTNSRGSVLILPLEDILAGLRVKGIEGLDPVKATLVSSSFANQDGEQYHSSRRESRNIKISLGLEPDYGVAAVKDLRDQLYNFFMPKSFITCKFKMLDKFAVSVFKEELDLEIDGRIETFDSPLFTKDPGADISVMCFNPDFEDRNPIVVNGMTVADLTESELEYVGTIETGVEFTIMPDRALTDFTIYHRPPDGTLRTTDFSYPLAAGDVLTITSVIGSKSVILTSGTVETSVLYAVSPQSAWLELQPGTNNLRVYAEGAPIPYIIQYTNKYGGL